MEKAQPDGHIKGDDNEEKSNEYPGCQKRDDDVFIFKFHLFVFLNGWGTPENKSQVPPP